MVTGSSPGLSLFETPFFHGSVCWQNLPSKSVWGFFWETFFTSVAVNYIVFCFIPDSSSLLENFLECFIFVSFVNLGSICQVSVLVQFSITARFLIMAHVFKMTHIFLGSNPWGKPFSSAVLVFWHFQSEVFKDILSSW